MKIKKKYPINAEGFLIEEEAWDKQWLKKVLRSKNIHRLDAQQQTIISFIINWYKKNFTVPVIQIISDYNSIQTERLLRLFNCTSKEEFGNLICKAIGLPKNMGCH